MNMKRWMTWVVVAGLCVPLAAAQEVEKDGPAPKKVAPEDPAHNELRELKAKLVDAFNKEDLDALLKYVHPNAVMTWQNAEVSRGHEGIRTYYQKMLEGPERRVEKVTAKADVDELTILYGDRNGLAFGTLDQDYTLRDGSAFQLKNRWTAHLVKENDQWLVSGLHVSANIFDNGVLDLTVQRTARWTGIAAGVGGLVLGMLVYWGVCALRRTKPTAGTTP
jgi:ketosteroid isomerase-like protein